MNSLIAPSPFSGIGHSHQKFIHCTDNIQMSQSSVRISPIDATIAPQRADGGEKKKKKSAATGRRLLVAKQEAAEPCNTKFLLSVCFPLTGIKSRPQTLQSDCTIHNLWVFFFIK